MRRSAKRENGTGVIRKPRNFFLFPVLVSVAFSFVSCITSEAKAEEYYALGTAYLELKKYTEAESWFTKSKFHEKTKIASEYNLGKIAYETGRYKEAEAYFDRILSHDAENVTALKAAAYTCIKLEDLERAEVFYRRILNLEPEAYDEGYNYALVLSALGKFEEAEKTLLTYNNEENPSAWLVLARAQRYQNKPEAADSYSASLGKQDDPEVRMEYAAYLEAMELPEKALEEYRKVLELSELSEEQKEKATQAVERLGGGAEDGETPNTDVEGGEVLKTNAEGSAEAKQ